MEESGSQRGIGEVPRGAKVFYFGQVGGYCRAGARRAQGKIISMSLVGNTI